MTSEEERERNGAAFVNFVMGALLATATLFFLMINLGGVTHLEIAKANAACELMGSKVRHVYLDGDFVCMNNAYIHRSIKLEEK
jgi:hypothetical protein